MEDMFWKDVQQVNEDQFRRLTGVKRATFEKMVKVLEQCKLAWSKNISRSRHSKLCVEDQVLMMLMYYQEYRPLLHIGLNYGISEVHSWRIVMQVEIALIQSKAFRLPGKKKRHKMKSQLVIFSTTKEIICTTVGKGRKHDFRVIKGSEVQLSRVNKIQANSGYRGIQKLYPAPARSE